jgi:L-alanine-DL-glutamate epimerase-like enolase superfamily enzyme
MKPIKLSLFTDRWELTEPFSTARETVSHIETLTACLNRDGLCGKGEALGVDYLGETVSSMQEQINEVRGAVESGESETGISGSDLLNLLPAGGARNAIDCAVWDLRAKLAGKRVWDLIPAPSEPINTVFTLSMDSVANMAREARKRLEFPILKLKLGPQDTADKLKAIHAAHPTAKLVIDANESWTLDLVDEMGDTLAACNVQMLEQPLPAGEDGGLAGFGYPVTLCADESCQSSKDLETCGERYQMVNIKLDKCGGLTEALNMVNWCLEHHVEMMVGNMLGSSLAMAPGFVVAQYCRFVDLDGPLWQKSDRKNPIIFNGARMEPPTSELWG